MDRGVFPMGVWSTSRTRRRFSTPSISSYAQRPVETALQEVAHERALPDPETPVTTGEPLEGKPHGQVVEVVLPRPLHRQERRRGERARRPEGDRRSCELGEQGTLDEIIVTIDDERKRLVYSIRESPFDFEHHSASMQVVPTDSTGARFIWVTDVKPDGAVPALTQAIDQAVESSKHTLR